jgi:mRNA interferase MazF
MDVEISDLDAANLPVESLVRMKLFTLDHRLVLRKIGRLATPDARNVRHSLTRLFPVNS